MLAVRFFLDRGWELHFMHNPYESPRMRNELKSEFEVPHKENPYQGFVIAGMVLVVVVACVLVLAVIAVNTGRM